MRVTGRFRAMALAAVLVAAGPAAVRAGHVLAHRCVEAGGSWLDLGLRLQLLSGSSHCPAGSFGPGVASRSALFLVSGLLPLLGVHVALGAIGLGLGVLGARAVRVVGALARAAVRRPDPVRWAPPVGASARRVVVGPAARALVLDILRTAPHRGPPLPA